MLNSILKRIKAKKKENLSLSLAYELQRDFPTLQFYPLPKKMLVAPTEAKANDMTQ